MKRYLMLFVLIGVFLGFGNAFANPYFPEEVGSTWSYMTGSDTTDAVMASPGNLMFGGDSNLFTTVGGAVYWTGITTPSDGSGRSYDPHLLALPASTSIGTYQHEDIVVNRWYPGGTGTQLWKVNVSIVDVVDVTVPIGKFDDCIWMEERTTRFFGDGTSMQKDSNIWYAEGVGIVQFTDNDDIFKLAAYNIASSNPVPEPTTMLLFGAGLIGLAGFGRKKFKK